MLEANLNLIIAIFGCITIITLIPLMIFRLVEKGTKRFAWLSEIFVAFAVGTLLGDVFIHIFPELGENGFSVLISATILGGMVCFFILEKVVHWHHCHSPTHEGHEHMHNATPYMIFLGDGIHNFIDGFIIAGAFISNPIIGLTTSLAVFAHEIPQEISDTAVLLGSGLERTKALAFNVLSGLTSIFGALFALILGKFIADSIPLMLAFAAGGFLYLAAADLIPQLNKHFSQPKAVSHVIAILFGIGVMALMLLIE
jgi:zinc and cadmium transporter